MGQREDRCASLPVSRGSGVRLTLAMAKLVHGLADSLPGLLVFLGLAAVPFLFPLGQGNFTLGEAVPKVDPQRH